MGSDQAKRGQVPWTPWVRWQNFRGFTDTDRVALKPLTVLLGANSSGKSSFYKPLLLMQQTLATGHERPGLVTRGELVNAGSFEDLVPLGDCDTKIQLHLGFHTHSPPKDLEPVGSYAPGRLDLTLGCNSDSGDAQLEQFDVRDVCERLMLRRKRLKNGGFSLRLFTSGKGEEPTSELDVRLRRELRNQKPSHFLFSGYEAFARATRPDSEEHDDATSRDQDLSFSEYFMDCAQALDYVEDGVRGLVRSFNYVGPLREPPRRIYEMSGEAPSRVGKSGEFAPEVFARAGSESELGRGVRAALKEFGFVDDLARTRFQLISFG